MLKKLIKSLSVFMVLTLILTILPLYALADENKYDGSLRVMAYNVSGLPFAGSFQGSKITSGAKKAEILGEHLNQMDLDLIGTQEDFNYHSHLAKKMTNFPYQTFTSGPIPLGDGLNIFSKFPIYNVNRTTWRLRHGVLTAAADQLTNKGFLRTVVEIKEGIYIDFYVLHADAGGDTRSKEARADNYKQLAAEINSRGDRAALVIGDFNSRLGGIGVGDIYENLMASAGLFDPWAELYNEGKYIYSNESDWNPSVKESIDKVLYKNGGGIEFSPENLEHYIVKDSKGKTYTDHHATIATLNYKIGNIIEYTEELKEPEEFDKNKRFVDLMTATFEALKLIILDLVNLPTAIFD